MNRFEGLPRVLTVAVPLALSAAGPVSADIPRSESEASPVTLGGGESEAEAVLHETREQRPRRFERRGPNREGRAFRQDRRNRGPARAGRPFGRRVNAELNLTEEQREQMRQTQDDRRDRRRQIADARRAFREAARDSERTAEELEALGEAVGRAQAQAVVQQRAARQRIASILTEEQRQQLEQMRENRGERFRSGPRAHRNGWRN